MRKDVKLGFAIGGVLLAVVVVYVLVVPTTNEKQGTQLVGGGDETSSTSVPGGGSPAGDTSVAQTSTPAPIAESDAAKTETASHTGQTPESPVASREGVDWGKLLKGDAQLTPVMSQTPGVENHAANNVVASNTSGAANTPAAVETASGTAAADAPGGASVGPTTLPTNSTITEGPVAMTTVTAPTTRPIASSRTHVVRQGETLSTIAAAVYGDARFYPYIKRANPTLDERKMKVGTVINIPDIAQVQSEASTATNATHATSNTGTTGTMEYRVQKGDNLYKISMKLYGSPSQVNKIYELNKSTIGADPAALKVGAVLKLPEAPTAGSATAASR